MGPFALSFFPRLLFVAESSLVARRGCSTRRRWVGIIRSFGSEMDRVGLLSRLTTRVPLDTEQVEGATPYYSCCWPLLFQWYADEMRARTDRRHFAAARDVAAHWQQFRTPALISSPLPLSISSTAAHSGAFRSNSSSNILTIFGRYPRTYQLLLS